MLSSNGTLMETCLSELRDGHRRAEPAGGHSPPYSPRSASAAATPLRGAPIGVLRHLPRIFYRARDCESWWGQAVGWKNYHEQWLSEGFAQYFAALYAERAKSRRSSSSHPQMTRWTIRAIRSGAVYLGYRIGHIKNDSRTFRALVYNKGAISLHMRDGCWATTCSSAGSGGSTPLAVSEAGTEDLRTALEAETAAARSLFARWIYGSTLPRMKFRYTTEPDAVIARSRGRRDLRRAGDGHRSVRTTLTDIMFCHRKVVERRIPTTGLIRSVEAIKDDDAPGFS